MNSLYTSGVRQTNSIQADLERLKNGDDSASLLGPFSPRRFALMHIVLLTFQECACFVRADICVFGSDATNDR